MFAVSCHVHVQFCADSCTCSTVTWIWPLQSSIQTAHCTLDDLTSTPLLDNVTSQQLQMKPHLHMHSDNLMSDPYNWRNPTIGLYTSTCTVNFSLQNLCLIALIVTVQHLRMDFKDSKLPKTSRGIRHHLLSDQISIPYTTFCLWHCKH